MNDVVDTPTPKRGWMKSILIVSLGLNLAVVGLVGGMMLRGGPEERFRAERDVGALGLRLYYRALDDGNRAALNGAIRANHGQFRTGRNTIRVHLLTLADALSADPYEPSAVVAELHKHGGIVSGNISLGQRLLMEQINAMSVDERKALSERLKSPRRRPEKR